MARAVVLSTMRVGLLVVGNAVCGRPRMSSEQLVFQEYDVSCRRVCHPTDELFERTDLQILTYRNLPASAPVSS